MKVAMIGSGNVATVLSKMIMQAGHQILQVYSRNLNHAVELAQKIKAEAISDLALLDTDADLFIVAVSDHAIPALSAKLRLPEKLVVHTAGSVSKNILSPVSKNYGVCYPLQSIRKNTAFLPDIPFLIDGCDEQTTADIQKFAFTLSTSVSIANDDERVKLHIAAVIVSNFVNHLYAQAEQFCQYENISFELLFPLIQETAQRVAYYSPGTMQTGPAVRKDVETLQKHSKQLKNYPQLKNLYKFLTDSIIAFQEVSNR